MPRGSIAHPILVPTGGERSDLPDNKVDANSFRLLQNMVLNRSGQLSMRPGYSELASSGPGTRIMGLVYWKTSAAADKTVAATRTGLWKFQGSSWTDITGGTVLSAATTDPDTARVDKLRSKELLGDVSELSTFVARMNAALAQRPQLAEAIAQATTSAYEVRKQGDDHDRAFDGAMGTLRQQVRSGADGLDADLLDRLKMDLETLQNDHDKWLAWRSDSISSYWI